MRTPPDADEPILVVEDSSATARRIEVQQFSIAHDVLAAMARST